MKPALQFLVSSLCYLPSLVKADGTITIASLPAYTELRACMQSCLTGGCNAYYEDIGCRIGCGRDVAGDYLDSCYCRTDLASAATSLISSCATANCVPSPDGDASAGVSLYAAYCHFAFPTTTPVTPTITLTNDVPASTSANGGADSISVETISPPLTAASTISIVTLIVTSIAEAPTSSSGDTDGGSQLSRSDVIAVVMGVLAVLATCIAAYVGRKAIIKVVRDRASAYS